MTFKVFIRRANRGIVLAILLIAVLAAYLTAGALTFGSERDAIKAMLDDYAKDSRTLLVMDEQYRVAGEITPDAAINKKIEQNEKIYEKYLTSATPTITNSWSRGAYESISENISWALSDNEKNGMHVTESDFDIVAFSVNRATATVATGTVTVKCTAKSFGPAQYSLLLSTDYQGNYYEYSSINGVVVSDSDGEAPDFSEKSHSQTVKFSNVIFKKVDGQWKISQTDGGYTYEGGGY